MTARKQPRIAIFNRYSLADQCDLATEFPPMIERLEARSQLTHMSFRGVASHRTTLPAVSSVVELPLRINRKSSRDILLKTALTYFLLPVAGLRLRRLKPDVVFLCETFPLWATILKLFSGCKLAAAYGDWHFHNILGGRRWMKPMLWVLERLDRFEIGFLSGFFCRSQTAAARLADFGVAPDRIRVVRDAPDPNAFYPQDQRELRRQCGFTNEDVVLLYHGVMHQGKGLAMLVRWVAELHADDPRIGLLLVGDGAERDALERQVEKRGITNRVYFTGWLETVREVGAFCNAADICVAMRTADRANEHIVPGALLHCMACRKVVVGPRLSGIAEIIEHGQNGFMFEPDDGENFKRLIRRLARERDQWDRIARRAYEDIAAHYSVESAAEKYADAIEHFAAV